jgi:transcription elongation factor Elf1
MGSFDSVVVACPKCTSEIEIQSKAGACILKVYNFDNVPKRIARSIEGGVEKCDECGTKFKIDIKRNSNDLYTIQFN